MLCVYFGISWKTVVCENDSREWKAERQQLVQYTTITTVIVLL